MDEYLQELKHMICSHNEDEIKMLKLYEYSELPNKI